MNGGSVAQQEKAFKFWMESSWSHAARSHPGFTGADVSSNTGQKTQLPGSVQFQL